MSGGLEDGGGKPWGIVPSQREVLRSQVAGAAGKKPSFLVSVSGSQPSLNRTRVSLCSPNVSGTNRLDQALEEGHGEGMFGKARLGRKLEDLSERSGISLPSCHPLRFQDASLIDIIFCQKQLGKPVVEECILFDFMKAVLRTTHSRIWTSEHAAHARAWVVNGTWTQQSLYEMCWADDNNCTC